MGAWGPGIYSNDTALDVRDTCQEVFSSMSLEEGNKILFDEYKEELNTDLIDDDYASFWYALADWQWKHGMLNNEIRDKTLQLLENYTGLDEWEADASKATVKKRKEALDKLKEQLLSPQPPLKKPKLKLFKPRHKPGDVVIFKTVDNPSWVWECYKDITPILLYMDNDGQIRDVKDDPPLDVSFQNKYMALLCVGSAFEKRYSRYLDVMDEYSLYAVYDYCSDTEPTLETLRNVGFLPIYDFDEGTGNKTLGLLYKAYFWNPQWNATCSGVKKSKAPDEYTRFCNLLQKAFVSDGYTRWNHEFDVPQAFTTKLYFERMGVKVNTLIDPDVVNPRVANYEEYKEYKLLKERNRSK